MSHFPGALPLDTLCTPLYSERRSYQRRGRDVPVSFPTEQELPHRTPPTPAPSEDRIFMDWNSIGMGSPPVRTPSKTVLVRERGQDIDQPAAQTTQPGSEPAQIGVKENALQEDPIVSSPRT